MPYDLSHEDIDAYSSMEPDARHYNLAEIRRRQFFNSLFSQRYRRLIDLIALYYCRWSVLPLATSSDYGISWIILAYPPSLCMQKYDSVGVAAAEWNFY